MRQLCCGLIGLLGVLAAMPAWSSEYMTQEMMPPEVTPPEVTQAVAPPAPDAGASLLAALSNLVYFPLRFTISLVTAEVGGFTGWMTGGDEAAAEAVWQSTEGQAFVPPEVIEERERLRFGRWQ